MLISINILINVTAESALDEETAMRRGMLLQEEKGRQHNGKQSLTFIDGKYSGRAEKEYWQTQWLQEDQCEYLTIAAKQRSCHHPDCALKVVTMRPRDPGSSSNFVMACKEVPILS